MQVSTRGILTEACVPDETFVRPEQLLAMADLPPVVREAAKQAQVAPRTVGAFLQAQSDEALAELLTLGLVARDSAHVRVQLAMLTVLLANAEGLALRADEDLTLPLRRLLLMVQAELWARRGWLRLPYATLTLERFDPQALELTPTARARLARIQIRRG